MCRFGVGLPKWPICGPFAVWQHCQTIQQTKPGPVDETTVRAIYREIMSGSRALQRMVKIAYLGGEYSYSHLAVLERFGQSFESLRVNSIAAVFEEVNRRHADYGVV